MKISNNKFQITNSKGYTLIELLIVMVVLVTVGIIVAAIIVSALRGTNKAKTEDAIRKNGNYTILQMSRMIEFAQSFQGVGTDGVNFTPICSNPAAHYNYIKITSFDNLSTTFACNYSVNPAIISSNSASFINTNEVTLTPNKCYFTCQRTNISDLPVIGISFELTQQSPSSFFENKASQTFSTSVIMRNLNK